MCIRGRVILCASGLPELVTPFCLEDTLFFVFFSIYYCVSTQVHSFATLTTTMFFSTLLTGVALMSTTGWAQYVLEDDYTANGNFFDQFEFFNGSDPTNGYVDYVERDYAESAGLIGNNYGKIYMGVDHSNVVGKAGRPAVRIESTKTYDSGLIIIDIEHMPGGICGTWPAFWMFGPNWPKNGEIGMLVQSIASLPFTDMYKILSRASTTNRTTT